MLRFYGVAFTVSLLADVVPHCGGPEVELQAPGEWCGHHGPRWRGDCVAPAACYSTEQHGRICTATCEQDADCAALGSGFTCSANGTLDASPGEANPRRVCAQVAK